MTKPKAKPQTIFIAELPEVFGYGITGYGATAEEAEAAVKSEFHRQRQNAAGIVGNWESVKEYFGFSIRRATTGTAHLDGCGDYVEV